MRIYLAAAVWALTAMPAFATEATAPPEGCVPHFENGQPSGYTCQNDQPSGNYQNLGPKNGDVIQGVDAKANNGSGKPFEILRNDSNEIQVMRSKDLQVTRDGQEDTVTPNDRQN